MKPEQIIIQQLYEKYQKQGYVTEEDIFKLCEEYDLSYAKTDYVGNQLLAKGILISDDIKVDIPEIGEKEPIDFAQLDYAKVYEDISKECPGLAPVVDCACSVNPPQKGELKQLFAQVRSGNRYARSVLIKKYIRFALRFTLYYRGKTAIPLDDIFSTAVLGVVKAVDSYDPYTNSYFSSYVTWWMRQNVDRYICDHERIVRLPVHMVEKINKAKEYRFIYQDESEQNAVSSIAEILEINLSEAQLIYHQLDVEPPVSIEEMLERDEEITTYESLYLEESVEEIVERRMFVEQVEQAVATLSEREYQVIVLRYGLLDNEIKTLEEIGQILSVTKERVRQIELKALRRLRHPSRKIYFENQ